MSKDLMVFEDTELGKVRIITEDENLYFVAKDVLTTLDYADTSKPAKVCEHVPLSMEGGETNSHQVRQRH